MCCLKYEQDAYEDLIRTAPKADSFVDTPDGRGTVSEVNLLRQNVKVRMEKAPETVNTYKNDEIYVIRSGKAKKTDPPIPEDFAPISSQRQAPRRRLDLEPMPEVVLSSEKQPAREGGERSGHNGHRRHGKPQDGERRRQEQTAAPAPQKEVPAPEASKNEWGEAAARSRNRRRRHQACGLQRRFMNCLLPCFDHDRILLLTAPGLLPVDPLARSPGPFSARRFFGRFGSHSSAACSPRTRSNSWRWRS